MLGGNNVQVQVQSATGLFADATKLKPRNPTLELIKGIIFGGTIGGFGLGALAGARDKSVFAGAAFGAVTGAAVGAFWQHQKTKTHNTWVETVAGRMGISEQKSAESQSFAEKELERKANAATIEKS